MKRTLLWMTVTSLVTGPALYASAAPQETTTKPATTQSTAKHSGHKASGHTMKAEFVSYDSNTKMLTLKDDKGVTSTAPVEGKALTDVTRVKTGDHVTLTMSDSTKAVTSIRSTTATKSKSKPKAS
jgi:hypothetical protein